MISNAHFSGKSYFFDKLKSLPHSAGGILRFLNAKTKTPGSDDPGVQFIKRLSLRGSAYRAGASASAAANAGVSVDNVLAVTLGNCVYRTSLSASAASDAIVRNYVCHIDLPPYKYVPASADERQRQHTHSVPLCLYSIVTYFQKKSSAF